MSYKITPTPITTPTDVKAYAKRRYLNFDYTVRYTNTILLNMIKIAQENIERQTGYLFNPQVVNAKWSGNELLGGIILQTPIYPIILDQAEGGSTPTLTVDGSELDLDSDYYVTDETIGLINTESYLPNTGYNNVTLEYTAGYLRALPTAKELCESIVTYTMLMERETPPSLQNIIDQTESGVYNKGTDKMDKLIQLSFNIDETQKKLPRRIFAGIIRG